MKDLKFTKQTEQVAFVFFTLYFVYGLFYTPFTQYLVSLAIGGIVYGIVDSAEIAVIALLAANYLFTVVKSNNEGFEDNAQNDSAGDDAIEEEVKKKKTLEGLGGVGSPMSEGFADAADTDMSVSETKETKEELSVGKSKPASADQGAAVDPKDVEKMADMMKKMMETMNTGGVLESSKATKISEKVPPAHQPQEKETFQESQTAGLFKLGQIPKDEKGGHHIDAGTTVMNAINALKPDQIKAMTMDTKQLIETQKSLMGMLQTFQPMVSEGKQMMETFQEMFSPAMGAMNTAGAMTGAK
jgi:hypothetical protein